MAATVRNKTRAAGNAKTDGDTALPAEAKIRRLGYFLLALPFLIFVILLAIWPTVISGKTATTWLFGDINAEISLFLVVLLAGGLGSAVFAARSFAAHLGAGDFGLEWSWWYVLRVPIGMGLALILYFVLRGGLFDATAGSGETTAVNPFGFASMSALAGMFAKQAANKLAEVFDTLFRTDERDEVAAERPKIASFPEKVPSAGATAAKDLKLSVGGSGFHREARVRVDGHDRPTRWEDATLVTATLAKGDVKAPGPLQIVVANPTGRGGPSAPATLEIKA